ncbi:hypothetical protein quinque_015902 [Culex quinquefasciatus]|uniref:Uncharacterized protein n=1 Tax=Culex pipiens pipiens TaxID=38569 RepID=A0ABD1CYI6_CULPP
MINVELLKKAPDEFVEKLHELIAVVWNSNVPPADFIDTVQVPIPKKPSPKATTDFRKITLCNVVYKVIATHLLYKLDEVTGELPTYQAVFLANSLGRIFPSSLGMWRCGRKGLNIMLKNTDLPNVNIKRNVEQFIVFFENPELRADGLKIYKTLVFGGAELYELWKTGRYKSSSFTNRLCRRMCAIRPCSNTRVLG